MSRELRQRHKRKNQGQKVGPAWLRNRISSFWAYLSGPCFHLSSLNILKYKHKKGREKGWWLEKERRYNEKHGKCGSRIEITLRKARGLFPLSQCQELKQISPPKSHLLKLGWFNKSKVNWPQVQLLPPSRQQACSVPVSLEGPGHNSVLSH